MAQVRVRQESSLPKPQVDRSNRSGVAETAGPCGRRRSVPSPILSGRLHRTTYQVLVFVCGWSPSEAREAIQEARERGARAIRRQVGVA